MEPKVLIVVKGGQVHSIYVSDEAINVEVVVNFDKGNLLTAGSAENELKMKAEGLISLN
ncbi:MAG: hypothetical protein JWN76_1460 [Chitinophagaceae bacterium]|nr:hypothetical protein [Chitinophagaceae bacterium]